MIQDDVAEVINYNQRFLPHSMIGKRSAEQIHALYEAHFNERLALIADKYVVEVECPECEGTGREELADETKTWTIKCLQCPASDNPQRGTGKITRKDLRLK